MKAQVLNFFYKGTKDSTFLPRQIFLMNLTEDYFQGFDFGELTPKERSIIKKTFQKRDVIDRFATQANPAKTIYENEQIKILIKKAWKTFKLNKENCRKFFYNKETQSFVSCGSLKCKNKKELQEAFIKIGTKEGIRKGVDRSLKTYTESFGIGFCKKTYKGFRIWGNTEKGKTTYQIDL